jgi:hypothetical protein
VIDSRFHQGQLKRRSTLFEGARALHHHRVAVLRDTSRHHHRAVVAAVDLPAFWAMDLLGFSLNTGFLPRHPLSTGIWSMTPRRDQEHRVTCAWASRLIVRRSSYEGSASP